MTIDLKTTPFSFKGSYLVISEVGKNWCGCVNEPGLYLRTVHGSAPMPLITRITIERKGGSAYADAYSDMEGKEASAKSSVDCKATDCMYNKECQCHAGKISVEGGNACHCDETECATFKCGCA